MSNIQRAIIILAVCFSSCVTNKTAEFYFQQGKSEAAQQNSYIAVQKFTKAIEINPNYVEAYMERAKVNMSIGCVRTAILDYDSVLVKIDENDSDNRGKLYVWKGDAYYTLKEYVLACAYYEKARMVNNNQSWDRIRERCKK